jgi:hypothetical protein
VAVAVCAGTFGPEIARRFDSGWCARPRGGSDAFSQQVALVYKAAVEHRVPPRHAVAAVWSRGLDAVDGWLAEARQRGALGHDTLARRRGRDGTVPLSSDIPLPRPTGSASLPSFGLDLVNSGVWVRDLPECPDWKFRLGLQERNGTWAAVNFTMAPDLTYAEGWTSFLTAGAVRAAPLDSAFGLCFASVRGDHIAAAARVALGHPSRDRGTGHLQQVARVYQMALALGVPPLHLVGDLWPGGYPTVSGWTTQARREGLLPDDARWRPHQDRPWQYTRPAWDADEDIS